MRTAPKPQEHHVLDSIPTPGHTAGMTSYPWNDGDRRFSFTGDFIRIERGERKDNDRPPCIQCGVSVAY